MIFCVNLTIFWSANKNPSSSHNCSNLNFDSNQPIGLDLMNNHIDTLCFADNHSNYLYKRDWKINDLILNFEELLII